MSSKLNAANLDKLNRKIQTVMTKLQSYNGTDPESIIQATYNKGFIRYFGIDESDVIRMEKCDAYFTADDLTTLSEYKFDVNLSNDLTRAKVLAQALFYYKRIIERNDNTKIPNVIFIGDVNECFCIRASLLNKYLNLENVDYTIAASAAGNQMTLVNALMNDNDIKHELFIVNPQKDNITYIYEKMQALAKNLKSANIPINKKNINRVFETFMNKVSNDQKYDANEIVGLFIDAIKYPNRRLIASDLMVVHPYKPLKVNTDKAISLFNFFGKPTDEDNKNLAMIYDTLVKDSERRKRGFFITPTIWTDLAHKYVSDYFESIGWDRNWEDNDKVVVWDCCCGTKSLTRNYHFKNLYLSTLEESELNVSSELSPEAKETFVFDFLNDSLSRLPSSLSNELKALSKDKSRKLVFFVNPPYGQCSGMGKDGKKHIVDTAVSTAMKQDKVAYCGMDLFVQFLYQMNNVVNHFKLNRDQVIISTFSKPTWLNGSATQKFRNFWFKDWTYDNGFIFNASEFAGCSDRWGVKFTIMHNVKAKQTNDFVCDVYENDNGQLKNLGNKTFHNVDDEDNMDVWAKGERVKTHKVVALHSGITPIAIKNPKNGASGMSDDFIGAMKSYGNVVQNNFANLATAPSTESHFKPVRPSNCDKMTQVNACRSLTIQTWLNDKDIYSKPNEQHPKYVEWVKDCYVNTVASLVTSMSGTVDGEAYDYKNNFFPFSKARTYELLGKELMKNETDEKRWCLENGKFDNPTPEGQAVLDAFANLIRASAPYRDAYGKEHPELQLDHWDAGFRQLRDMLKEVCPNELKAYKAALKVLQDKMRPMIYELGFLRK